MPNINRSMYSELYLNQKKRLATCTGSFIIDDTYIIVINLVAMMMYLYHFDIDTETYELLHQIDTTYNNKLAIVDLLDYKNGYIVTSNFDEGTQSFYRLINNKLTHSKDVPYLHNYTQSCHGVKFYNDTIICATGNMRHMVYFINHITNDIIMQITYLESYNPKDISIINDNIIAVAYSTSKIGNIANDSEFITKIIIYSIDIYNKSYSVLCELIIPLSHCDSITHTWNNNKCLLFINDQNNDNVNVIHYDNVNNKMCIVDTICDNSFPHGVSYNNGLLAICNYGTNSVRIMKYKNDCGLT